MFGIRHGRRSIQVSRHRTLVVACLVSVVAVSTVLQYARTSATVSPCGTVTGDGSQLNPWKLWTDQDLACFAAGTTWVPAGGGLDAYATQNSDLTWSTNLQIFVPLGFDRLHYDGNGFGITIKDVTDFFGLFGNSRDADIRNLTVRADNSTLQTGSGWLSHSDSHSSFTNVASTGPISIDAGGIVGSADGTTITTSLSTGSIADNGGGLVGIGAKKLTITNSYSTGSIGQSGGGLVGRGSTDATVTNSYSAGTIDASAGGIIGDFSTRAVVANSYSTGMMGIGAGAVIGGHASSPTEVNSANFGGGWSDTTANAMLTGLTSTWRSCGINLPYLLAAFYPTDICSSSRSARVTFDGSSVSTSDVVSPVNDTFSLVNQGHSGPFSFVSVVNDSGLVTMNGAVCSDVTACPVRDLAQSGEARRDVVITRGGKVSIRRYDAWSGTWLASTAVMVAPVPTTTTSIAPPGPPTTTPGAQSGTNSENNRKPFTVRRGKTVSRSKLLKWAALSAPKGSRVLVKIGKPSRRNCVLKGTSVRGVKVGKCKVSVKVASNSGRKVSKALTIMVIR